MNFKEIVEEISKEVEGDIDSSYYAASPRIVKKGWGGEFFAYHTPQEHLGQKLKVDTVKLMHFEKDKRCSIHFHNEKSEYFVCVIGQFKIEISNAMGVKQESILNPGQRLFIPRQICHRIIGLGEENVLLEVSTLDKDEDSIRIEKGD